jgi:hypothetical protein
MMRLNAAAMPESFAGVSPAQFACARRIASLRLPAGCPATRPVAAGQPFRHI